MSPFLRKRGSTISYLNRSVESLSVPFADILFFFP